MLGKVLRAPLIVGEKGVPRPGPTATGKNIPGIWYIFDKALVLVWFDWAGLRLGRIGFGWVGLVGVR